ncbi:hypothetical protein, partial [Ancylobacter lacus]|uniref:hypothetical protein n=1 Tax=Ancylobacter lacus TaxID=2579970 RepID=UPI001BCAADF9
QNEAFVPLPDGRRIPVAMSVTSKVAAGDGSGSAFAAAAALNRAADRMAQGGSSSGGGGVKVNVIGARADQVDVQSQQDSDGSTRLDIVFDQQQARNVATPGSRTRAALGAVYGSKPRVAQR